MCFNTKIKLNFHTKGPNDWKTSKAKSELRLQELGRITHRKTHSRFYFGGMEYNNILQPRLLKAGNITLFFMLQDFRNQNRDRKG